MKTLLRPALGAVLLLVVAACADPSGQPWTPPPPATPAAETTAPASVPPSSPAPSVAPSVAPSAGASAPAESAVPGARVIDLELTGALEIKENGTKVTDIPVTPGETVTFRITNTAGFPHNFWIGTDQELQANQVTGLAGIPDWSDAAPQELTWVVPADVTGLKFGCTVPGHYSLMQGTFSASAPAASAPAASAPAASAPAASAPAASAPAATPAPASAAPSAAASAPASSQEPAGRVVQLELSSALEIKENGTKVTDIPVTPGETIVFKVTNTAGFPHNFWIGPDQALGANQTAGLTGIPDWSDPEPKELTWVVPDDVTSLKFGCTVPGHYTIMNGTFSVAS